MVAEGGLWARVAEAVHQFLGAGAGARCERARQVAEVMEVEVAQSKASARLRPMFVEDVGREGITSKAAEHVTLGSRLPVLGEVDTKVGDDRCGDRDGPAAGLGLGWADEVRAGTVELALLGNGELAGVEFEVAATEA